MNELQKVFNYNNSNIRVILIDGNPWFVAVDTCKILGLDDARKAVARLDEDERNTIPVTDALGRMQETFIINEPGLYSLILTSRKPEAKMFKRWITHEVIPSIRQTGSYSIDGRRLPRNYVEALEDLVESEKRSQLLLAENAEMKPKALIYDELMATKNAQSIGAVAKAMGVGEKKLFEYLRRERYLYIDDGCNIPYEYHIKAGRFTVVYKVSNGRVFRQSLMYPKGIEHLCKHILETYSGFDYWREDIDRIYRYRKNRGWENAV